MNSMRRAAEVYAARRQSRIAAGRGRRAATSPGGRGVRVRRSPMSWGRWGRVVAPLAIAALFAVGLQALPAYAAGPGVLSITPTIVDPTTGALLAVVDPAVNTRYRVDYSFTCSVAACDNTTVTVAPNPKDPYYNQFVLESAGYTFTPPYPGATATGSPAAGITVNLGNVANGFSGVFQIYYTVQNRPGLPSPGSPGSFFPNGWVIPASATIQSTTAVGPATGSTSATWVSRSGAPTHYISGPTSTRTDTAITISIGAYSACNYVSTYNLGVEWYQCAKSWVVSSVLPIAAQYVAGSAGAGAVYDSTTRTITWTGADTTSATTNARGPLGRSYQVTFPSSGMPTTGAGCVATQTFSSDFSLVLLDGTPQNAPTRIASVQAQNCDPFSGMTTPTKTTSANAGTGTAPIVYIPAAGQPANGRYWTVTAGNTANVAGVATITDADLDQADMPVNQIYNPGTATVTVAYTLKDAGGATTTGTATLGNSQSVVAPAGRRFVSATVTSAPLAGPNASPASQTNHTDASISFYYSVSPGAAPGTRTNTASVTMSYPGYSLAPLTGSASRTVTLQAAPVTPPALIVSAQGPNVVGGGNIVAGSTVSWGVGGQVTNAPNNTSIIPQYVFIAPATWSVTGTAWSATPPAGTTVVQRQVTIAGQLRNIVVATWPAALTIPVGGSSPVLPVLYVNTSPTAASPAGITSATMLMGDANRGVATYSPAAYTETVDLAADGTTGDQYAQRAVNANVTGTPALTVTKEICRPDGSGGCVWIADPNVIVGVEPTATSIKYRITITNSGTAQANNVTAYDVLPYIGDAGLTDASSAVPRGSTVKETLNSVSGVPGDVALAYSTSTNPPRPGVYTGTTTGDWLAPAAGANALRATITALAAGASRSFTYDAALSGGSADNIACNSVAGIATSLSAVEPSAVCATTQEADLSVTGASHFPLQVGRVGTVPFVVNNGGGSQLATGTVTIDVPAGLTIATLVIAGWDCTSASLTGPVTITCDPVDGAGSSRQLQKNVPETIALQVTPSSSTSGSALCFPTSIAGIMNDPVPGNNAASVCSTVFAATSLLSVSKTDGVTAASVGDILTYTITAANLIVDQGLTGMTVTDALPSNVEWVSGGTVSGQDANGLGGTVTFPASSLTAAGASNATGSVGTGNAGSSTQFTVTVRVAATATGTIVNNVTAKVADPLTSSLLTATSSDTDQLQRLTVTKASSAPAAGVRTGDVVTYTVTLTNDGTAAYTAGSPARVLDDLAGVLDDAAYVSGTASVDGGASTAVTPDASKHLVWSGALAAGSTVTIVYNVTVGAGSDKVLTNTAYASGQVGTSCAGALDQAGFSCATVQSIFAPLVGKRIQSLTQNDDGTWTIVYAVDVTNPSPVGTNTYNLSDTLKFGAGIQLLSASATMPAGVTAATPAWSGSGPLAVSATIAGGAQQTYLLTVTADAHQVAGTAAASCVTHAAGGFANQATLSLAGLADATAEACAAPVKPTIQKSVGAPIQQPNGSWNVVYTVTVRNSNTVPADLAYTVRDALGFPVGTSINSVQVTGPNASGSFDGVANQALLSGVGRIPAPTGAQAFTTRVYTVTVNVDAPVGAVAPGDLVCTPTGGGYANAATLFAGTGSTSLGTASACAPVTVAPLPTITKKVVSSTVGTDGNWTLVYQIDVRNPDGTYDTIYSLDDSLDFATGVSVISAVVSGIPAGVTPDPAWDGVGSPQIVQNQTLSAGQGHSYQITVVADPGTLDPESAAADCLIDSGESGTGFRNVATVASGVKTAAAEACEPATDPSVVKTVAQQPTQNPTTGVWTVKYLISVTNKSTTTQGTIPYTVEDALAFPSELQNVTVTTSAGSGAATPEADFDGSGQPVLAHGAIGAAADASTPALQTYTVTVTFTQRAGITADVQCDVNQGQGGLQNVSQITVGQRTSGSVACVDLPDVATPAFSKTVTSQKQLADGTWSVDYLLTVVNPSASAASRYSIGDGFELGGGMTVDDASVISAPAGVTTTAGWNGDGQTQLVSNVLLPAGGTHTYTVRAVVDAGSVTASDPAADCTLTAGELGTGLRNGATLGTGLVNVTQTACASTFDPGVTKTLDGAPVQQSDGSWLLDYTITVTNPSNVQLSYGLEDSFGFPTATTTTVESATGPGARSDWDGDGQPTLVDPGQPLAPNAVAQFHVSVRATLPDGQASTTGGWANTATVASGTGAAITSSETASADIDLPELEVTKGVAAGAVIRIGDQVSYEITVSSTGSGDFTSLYPAVVWDDLTGVLDDATLDAAPTVTPNVGLVTVGATSFDWRGALDSGDSVTVQYTVTVKNGGDADLVNVAFGAQPDDVSPVAPVAAACTTPGCAITDTAMPALLVQKHADELMTTPGGVVHYTVTVTNSGAVDIPGASPATVTDDLSAVLAHATYSGDATVDVGSVTVSGSTLSWTGGLNAGATATIRYSVKVDPHAPMGTQLVNVAFADPTLATLSLAGDPAPSQVSASTTIGLLAFTGATIIGAICVAAVLLVGGLIVYLFPIWRRRRGENRQPAHVLEV